MPDKGARDVAVFTRLAHGQCDWTAEAAQAEVKAYADRKLQRAMGPLATIGASGDSEVEEATTQPADDQHDAAARTDRQEDDHVPGLDG